MSISGGPVAGIVGIAPHGRGARGRPDRCGSEMSGWYKGLIAAQGGWLIQSTSPINIEAYGRVTESEPLDDDWRTATLNLYAGIATQDIS